MLPYVLSIFGTVFCAAAILVKGKKMQLILLLVTIGNLLAGVSYLITPNGINGAVSCFLGAGITLLNWLWEKQGKDIPRWLTVAYALLFTAVNVLVSPRVHIATLFVIGAALCFVLSTVQKSGKMFRIYTFANGICWILYDLLSASYQGLILHATVFLITAIGMLIHDRKTKA